MRDARPGPAGQPSDADLVKRFQSGKNRDDAFMQLFERYGPITYAFLRRRIGNGDVAAEGDWSQAVASLEQIRERTPSRDAALYHGHALLMTGDYGEADEALADAQRKSEELGADLTVVFYVRGVTAIGLHDLDAARRFLSLVAVTDDPLAFEAEKLLGRLE